MNNTLIDLSGKTDPQIAECLKEIKNIADTLSVDFFVVGAVVRDLILVGLYNVPTDLKTMDIDLGISVTDWDHYQKIKDLLIETGYFSQDLKTIHRLNYKTHFPVDIIPFGNVETKNGLIVWPPDHAVEMDVTGFQDVLNDTILVSLAKNLRIRFVSLAGMAVLKIIAWNDRHNEFPTKDAADIALLLRYYGEAGNEARLFDTNAGLMETEQFDFELAGARLLGRDMTEIMGSRTRQTVLKILNKHSDPDKNDSLIINVMNYLPEKNYERAMTFLQNLKSGIQDIEHY